MPKAMSDGAGKLLAEQRTGSGQGGAERVFTAYGPVPLCDSCDTRYARVTAHRLRTAPRRSAHSLQRYMTFQNETGDHPTAADFNSLTHTRFLDV